VRTITGLGLLMAGLTAACSFGVEPAATSTPARASSSSTPPAAGALDASGCPEEDAAFCAVAADVGNALVEGDIADLMALNRIDTIVCADVSAEYFPGCAQADTVEGHGVSDAGLLVTMLDTAAYRDRLGRMIDAIDPSFIDPLGDGAVRLLGVGTCGPDQPGRRSYHLAWTAATLSGGEPRRMVGSFELTYSDDWRIALWYLDTYESWVAAGQDPLREAFCEAGRHPWRP
jgi:hypothetical protein